MLKHLEDILERFDAEHEISDVVRLPVRLSDETLLNHGRKLDMEMLYVETWI